MYSSLIIFSSAAAATTPNSYYYFLSRRTVNTNKNNHNDTTNYFELLEQPQSFSISLPLLKESYQSLMKVLHPDKHTLQSPEKQHEAADLSSRIIRGYEVLKDDYQRALHLLELHGEEFEAEGTTASIKNQENKDIVDMDVLLMVMEIREQIDRISSTNGNSQQALNKLLEENQKRIVKTVELLREAFGRSDWVDAKKLVATLQYWNRIKETIVEKL